MSTLKTVIVVGAGIGGAAVAAGLAKNGLDVTIYERSTATDSVGYSFRITPNSDRCLKTLGIDTEAGGAVSANIGRVFDAEGNIVHRMTENKTAQTPKPGTSVFAYRPQLATQLIDAAVQSGVHIKRGVKVASVDVTTTTLELEDGSRASADLIIAADGVHSVVRSHIIDTTKHSPQASTGHNALRFMVDKPKMQNDDLLGPLISDESRMFSWSGHGKRVLVYPVDFGKQFNITCTHPAALLDNRKIQGDSDDAVDYNQKVSLETVLDIYHDFEPRVKRLLELAEGKQFRRWPSLDMDEIETWSRSNVVLLGDACHPVQPFGFSGASMAIEDAATLSVLLTKDLSKDQIPARLKLYEEIRKPRLDRVRHTARVIAVGENDTPEFLMGYMKFLGSHDAIEHAKEALQHPGL